MNRSRCCLFMLVFMYLSCAYYDLFVWILWTIYNIAVSSTRWRLHKNYSKLIPYVMKMLTPRFSCCCCCCLFCCCFVYVCVFFCLFFVCLFFVVDFSYSMIVEIVLHLMHRWSDRGKNCSRSRKWRGWIKWERWVCPAWGGEREREESGWKEIWYFFISSN